MSYVYSQYIVSTSIHSYIYNMYKSIIVEDAKFRGDHLLVEDTL